jgi:hypothetical protein
MKNRWSADKHSIVEWEAVFPPVSNASDITKLLQFARELLAAGEREEVFQIVETSGPNAYHAKPGFTYADYLEQTLNETNTLPLFDLFCWVQPTHNGQLRTPGRVCYFDKKGKRVENEVENLGDLLVELRPKDVYLYGNAMQPIAPISLSGKRISADKSYSETEKEMGLDRPYVFISLHTDIWFPWVHGIMEAIFPARNKRGMYNNRKLALCHTPRLNRFIAAVRAATLELGGNWSYEVDVPAYAPMVTETGILLDV